MIGRKVIQLICIVVVAFLMVFASLTLPSAQAAQAVKKAAYVLKCATLAPEGVGWALLIKKHVSASVKSATEGDVVLDWFMGGVLGDDEDYIAKMRHDQLQGAFLSGAGATITCPEITVLELPFLFNNSREVDVVLNKLREYFVKAYEKYGYKLLVLGEQDFDRFYSVKVPIKDAASVKQSRMLTWYGSLEQKVLTALGANPIPVGVPEVCSSVRTGVCDAFIAPGIWVVGSQIYTVVKYVNPTPIRYSPGVFIVSLKAWSKLPEKYRDAIEKALLKVDQPWRDEVRVGNLKCYNAMLKYGLKEVKMSPAETQDMTRKVLPVWDEFASNKTYPKSLLVEIKQILADYRAGKNP
jgi:TRAP-type C4-dicarboxylate transport system substrate-binding protein